MVDYLGFAVCLLLCTLDVSLLYIWLRVFAQKRKNVHRMAVVAVILLSITIWSYVNCKGSIILSLVFGIFCFALTSVLLFEDRIKYLFLYTISSYVVGMASEVVFDAIGGMMGIHTMMGMHTGINLMPDDRQVSYGLSIILFMLLRKVVKFIAYYLMIKMFSARAVSCKSAGISLCMERQLGLLNYISFYSIPIITCALLTGIYISWDAAVMEHGILTDGLAAAAAVGMVIINTIALYLFEELGMMMARNRKMELSDMRSKLELKYYAGLDDMHEKYDVFLHDMRHTMRTIAALSEEGNCEEIGRIIGTMRTSLGSIDEQLICSNKILNALFSERKGYAQDNGVHLKLEISEPLYFKEIDELDLITLMGNLLDNAIEAEILSVKKKGILCNMHMASNGRHMVIQVENSYEEEGSSKVKLMKRQERIGEKHGIGLGSIAEIVRKYGGLLEKSQGEGRYNVKIILPVQSGWEEDPAYTETVPAYVQSAFK